MFDLHDLTSLAQHQVGLLTRKDLGGGGVSPAQRRGLVGAGLLEPVGARTFALGGRRPGPQQRVMAACLDTGGVACRGTAAWLHGLPGFEAGDPPAVVVPKVGNSYRSSVAEVHASTWLPSDDIVHV